MKPPKCYHSEENDVVDWILTVFSKNDRDKFTHFSPPSEYNHGKTKFKSLDAYSGKYLTTNPLIT
jgi:dGTPase